MAGIYERRSVEWVLNIMLNPDQMLKEDPIAIALLKEYNNILMLNQNLSENEAKEIADKQRQIIVDNWQAVCDEAELTEVDRRLFWQRQFLNPYAFED